MGQKKKLELREPEKYWFKITVNSLNYIIAPKFYINNTESQSEVLTFIDFKIPAQDMKLLIWNQMVDIIFLMMSFI